MSPFLPCALTVLSCAVSAAAGPVKGIQSALVNPIAPRGGVMMLPLTADRNGDQWPGTIDVTLDDGRTLTGHVAWMEAAPPRDVVMWTDDPRGVVIRPIAPADDSSTTLGAPYLLLELPRDGDGVVRLPDQALTPTWCDAPHRLPADSGESIAEPTAVMPFLARPDRPDPTSPFEYWRWVLLAEKLNMIPPRPEVFDPIGALAARHYRDLCRIALGRLAQANPDAARTCRDHLTRICTDRGQPFAAWVADPARINRLLSYLLDFDRSPEQLAAAAEPWSDWNTRLLIWPESVSGDQVRLAAVNPGADRAIMTLTWRNTDGAPIGVSLEPGVLTRVRIERPEIVQPLVRGLPTSPTADQHVLHVEVGDRQWDLQFGPRRIEARPPGVFLNPLGRPLTLVEVQRTTRRQMVGGQRATLVSVRRRAGRWEIFIECRRPSSEPGVTMAQDALEQCADYTDTIGLEAVTVLLGDDSGNTTRGRPLDVVLSIPESGWYRLFHGDHDGTLQIHRRSFADRWYCRIVLPRSWTGEDEPEQSACLFLGCIRTHSDNRSFEAGPGSPLPWRMQPARVSIDLSQWEDRPSLEGTTP